jgi:hypothetical protein
VVGSAGRHPTTGVGGCRQTEIHEMIRVRPRILWCGIHTGEKSQQVGCHNGRFGQRDDRHKFGLVIGQIFYRAPRECRNLAG